jgi:hypothetical protein
MKANQVSDFEAAGRKSQIERAILSSIISSIVVAD